MLTKIRNGEAMHSAFGKRDQIIRDEDFMNIPRSGDAQAAEKKQRFSVTNHGGGHCIGDWLITGDVMNPDPDFSKNGSPLRTADSPRPASDLTGDAAFPRTGANFPQDADDTALLKQFADGQGAGGAEAFAGLVGRHTGLVFDIVLRVTGSRPLAEEIVQTVFIQLARKAARVAKSRAVAARLHRAAVLESRAVLRAESRRRKHTAEAAADMATDFPDSSSSQSSSSAPDPRMTELLRSLDEALESLPATEREVLLRHYYERQSYQEAGQRLGTSEAGARQLAARARKRLASWFRQRHGADVSISVSGISALLAGHSPPAGQAAASSHGLLAEAPAPLIFPTAARCSWPAW